MVHSRDAISISAICNEFSIFGPDFFGGLLEDLNTRYAEWEGPLASELADPLFPERNFTVPNGVDLISFQPTDGDAPAESIADLFVGLLKDEDALFGATEVDPVTGKTELGINLFIRDSLLNEQGVFSLDIEELRPDVDPVVFDGEDRLTKTNITIDSIQVDGLDTLQTFNAFQTVGEYTLSNDLMWDRLALKANLTVSIQPSTLPNSMIVSPRPIRIVEKITVGLNMTLLDVGLSLFLAVDRTKFDDLKQIYILGVTLNRLASKVADEARWDAALSGLRDFNKQPGFYNGYARNYISKTVKNNAEGDPRVGFIKEVSHLLFISAVVLKVPEF